MLVKLAIGLAYAALACGCANSPQTYCDPGIGDVSVTDIYVFGGYEHGATVVDAQCTASARRLSLHNPSMLFPSEAAEARVRELTKSMFFRPNVKSGMFKFSGLIRIDTEGRVVIRDVSAFEEVDSSERDRVYSKIKENN